jgi:hypothetical protein
MNSNQLDKCLKKIVGNQKFKYAVIAADHVNKILKSTYSVYIINIDPSTMSGSHWIAAFIRKNRFEIFDPLGGRIATYSAEYFKQISQHVGWENTKQIQSSYSISCGIFCLYYIYLRLKGTSSIAIVNKFCSNYYYNEMFVNCWFKKYFKILLINKTLPYYSCKYLCI